MSKFSDGICDASQQKRRERINEKLRVLQQLIPNGTKVSSHWLVSDSVIG